MEDILNDMFRIVETHGKFSNSYHIEEHVTTNNTMVHKLFGFKSNSKWKRLRVKHYTCLVNRQYGYETVSYSYGSTYGAKKFLDLYIEYLKAKPVKYKGRTFKPMLFYGQQTHKLYYYDTKSYRRDGDFDYGYSIMGKLYTLMNNIDEKEVEGKVVKIHKVT